MRLLAITASYPPHEIGGYEIRCKDVLDSLERRGHKVLLITTECPVPGCDKHATEEGIRRVLHEKPDRPNILRQVLTDRQDLICIDREMRAFKPDIVYLWAIQTLSNAIMPYLADSKVQIVYDEGGSGIAYLTKILKRGIYFYRNEHDAPLKKWLKNAVYHLASFISLGLIKPQWSWPRGMQLYFNSYSGLRQCQSAGGAIDNAVVIHSGIDLAAFPYRPRERLGSPTKIITAGRIKPVKGTGDAILLAHQLRSRGVNVRLVLVGPVQSQSYFDEVTRSMHECGLGEVAEWLPMQPREDLARHYHAADVCFFPSYFKTGFSRVPLEAMASGCLVISYGNEGSAEIIKNAETGFIVGEGDIESAAAIIDRLVRRPEEYRRITRSARSLVESRHTLEAYIDAIEAYLQAALARGGTA